MRSVLDNGAILLVQERSTTPAVTIHASFLAGALYEPARFAGLAQLTGRLLDRGTVHRSASMIAEELDDRGVALQVTANRHVLALSCTCLAEHFGEVLSLVVDLVGHPTFPEDEVEKRRNETITAIRQDDDNPAVRATEAALELLYGPDHAYARRTKGTIASVGSITRSDIVDYHRRRINPTTLSLAVVGDVSAAHVLAGTGLALDGWSGATPDHVPVPPPSTVRERRTRLIPMPGKSQSDVAYGFTAVRRLDPRYYACWMMNTILGQFGIGGRLGDNIRERQGMAYYAYSTLDAGVAEGPLLVRAGVDRDNVARAIQAIDFEVERLREEGPTGEEMEAARSSLIGSILRMLETNQSIAAFLQTAELFGLGVDYDQRLPLLLHAVTLDEVKSAAAEILRPEIAAVAVAGPPAEHAG